MIMFFGLATGANAARLVVQGETFSRYKSFDSIRATMLK